MTLLLGIGQYGVKVLLLILRCPACCLPHCLHGNLEVVNEQAASGLDRLPTNFSSKLRNPDTRVHAQPVDQISGEERGRMPCRSTCRSEHSIPSAGWIGPGQAVLVEPAAGRGRCGSLRWKDCFFGLPDLVAFALGIREF